MFLTKVFQIIILTGFTATFLACSSGVKMADIPATADPREEISKLESDLEEAKSKNIDVLASKRYSQSESYLEKARSGIERRKNQSDILDNLRAGKGSLIQAYEEAGNRENQAQGLFEARQMALKAGAGTFTELKSDLDKLDRKVSRRADKLDKTKAELLSEYQNEYIDLERRSVILSQLSRTQALVNGAKKLGAEDKAPISFKKAELSLNNAESIISSNVRNPRGFRSAVERANEDADKLSKVMATIQQSGGNLNESVAIRMVQQDQTITGLEQDLGELEGQRQEQQSEMRRESDRFSSAREASGAALSRANMRIEQQRAIELARSEFSTAEAEAYQQGDNLVIRLKRIDFASGQSNLPENSFPILAKVLNVANSLNTSSIRVEGHTDSTGSDEINQPLSQDRANAVASYFRSSGINTNVNIESQGFGFNRPIASNTTREGRAQNRRVDVVISLDNTDAEASFE